MVARRARPSAEDLVADGKVVRVQRGRAGRRRLEEGDAENAEDVHLEGVAVDARHAVLALVLVLVLARGTDTKSPSRRAALHPTYTVTTCGDSDVISFHIAMPAGFRRHLVGKTLINVCYSAVTNTHSTRFVGRLMIMWTFC